MTSPAARKKVQNILVGNNRVAGHRQQSPEQQRHERRQRDKCNQPESMQVRTSGFHEDRNTPSVVVSSERVPRSEVIRSIGIAEDDNRSRRQRHE